VGSSGPERVAAVATFQAVIDRYLAAYAGYDAAGCAALYGADGEIHSPFARPAKGQSEIEATHGNWFEDGETNKTMRVTHAGIDGDLGYCCVEYEADVPGADGGTDRFRGTSLNVMERRTGGDWTIKLTSLNEAREQGTDHDT